MKTVLTYLCVSSLFVVRFEILSASIDVISSF